MAGGGTRLAVEAGATKGGWDRVEAVMAGATNGSNAGHASPAQLGGLPVTAV